MEQAAIYRNYIICGADLQRRLVAIRGSYTSSELCWWVMHQRPMQPVGAGSGATAGGSSATARIPPDRLSLTSSEEKNIVLANIIV